MPSTMVPSIWMAYWYSNGGLNTGPLTKWWSEYQTTVASSIWIANHTTSEQIPMIWTSSLLRSLLYTEIKKNCVYRWTIKEKDYMDVENAMLNNFNKFLSNKEIWGLNNSWTNYAPMTCHHKMTHWALW